MTTDQRLQRTAVEALLRIADELRRLAAAMDRVEAHLDAIAAGTADVADAPARDPLAEDPAAGAAPRLEGPRR